MSDYYHSASHDAAYTYGLTLSLSEYSNGSNTANEGAESVPPQHRYKAPAGGYSHGLDSYLSNSAATTLNERPSMQATLSAIDGIIDLRSSLPHTVAGSSRIQAPPLQSSSSSVSDSTATPSVFSTGDSSSRRNSSSTTGTSAEQSISLSLGGGVPSHTQPFINELEVQSSEVREYGPVSCPLKDILQSPCDDHPVDSDFEPWYRHVMSHFDCVNPPPAALCVFCNASFGRGRPRTVWKDYLQHLWSSHLRNGRDIVEMRADFVSLKYFLEKDMITQERYDVICQLANERNFSFLRPKKWKPDEREAQEYRDAKRDAIVFVESPARRRPRAGYVSSGHTRAVIRGHAS